MSKLKEKFVAWMRAPVADLKGTQVSSGIGVDGLEYPDPVPFAPPTGLRQPESQADVILRMIRSERLRVAADEEGFDTEEEADDFDVDDDQIDPTTPWEEPYLPPKQPSKAAQKAADAPVPPASSPATPNSVATPSEAPIVSGPIASSENKAK